jgi:nucleotide-binding universal stress UspA family protein
MFTRLLVGLDGSSGADAALEAALALGRRFKTTIVLAAITDIRLLEAPLFETTGPLWTEGLPAAPIAAELREALDERAGRILELAAARVAEAGLACEPVRAVGLADEELIRLADRAEAIVVGRRGELHGEPGTLGAVTVRIIKHSPKPVLVAGETPTPCERPLVALDGGETSNHALVLAARYAEALGIPITVVHASDDAEAADELLARAAAFLAEKGVAAKTRRLTGGVTEAITRCLVDEGADLLIAGAHGGRRHVWAFGSHTEKLLRAARVPVIIHR